MERMLARLFGRFLLIFTLCLIVASCEYSGDQGTTELSSGDEKGFLVETTIGSMDIQDHDHIYELTVLVPPSCGVEGRQAYVCVICGKQQYETSVEALPHNYKRSDVLSTRRTCTTDGQEVYCCSTCGCTQAEVLEATGHWWRTKTTCDSSTNELIITPYCTRCSSISAHEYRYKINDVETLIPAGRTTFGELDYTIISGDTTTRVAKAPYYGVYCEDTCLLIVRNVRTFGAYDLDGSALDGGPVGFYTSRGCTIVYEATISITADGCIKIIQ